MIYDSYKDKGLGIWSRWGNVLLSTDKGIYSISMRFAIFSAAISFILAVCYLAIFANNKAREHEEAKKWVVRVFVLSILLFGVSSLVTLIGGIGLD